MYYYYSLHIIYQPNWRFRFSANFIFLVLVYHYNGIGKNFVFEVKLLMSRYCNFSHGIKKTRYDITHFTESQHGKYGDLKNG